MNDKKNDKTGVPGKKRSRALIIALLLVACICGALYFYPGASEAALGLLGKIKGIVENETDGAIGAKKGGHDPDAPMKLQNTLAEKFEELEMRESDYKIQYFPKDSVIKIEAQVPRGRPIEWIVWLLSSAASAPYRAADCVCATDTRCEITFASESAEHPHVSLKINQAGRYLSNTAKMAVLVENFGFEATQAMIEYLNFPEPLTVSLVPARELAAWTAQIADKYKKEVVLSLPMEPLPAQWSGYRNTMVMVHYDEQRIRGIIAAAAVSVPNFSGVANFHGSRVMEDTRAMEIIFSEISRRKAYFVYSDVSKKSVAPQLTKSMNVPSYPIQGTIEAGHTAEQVRERMRKYAIAAEKTGKILIKAPPTPAFIQVLKEETPGLKNNGIRLVYVSELIK